MSDFINNYVSNKSGGSNTHLRDQRHALRFYKEHGHLFAPKVKFLYHIVFDVNPDALAPNTKKFREELAVLATNVSLPKFTAQVDNKKQYNRVKHFQTRIDYSDVSCSFYDDNLGASRALLEEYYRYYSADGNTSQTQSSKYGSRDKYNTKVHNYGLNNGTTVPFFNYIRIYQLSLGSWFSYQLVNPLLTSWGHDALDFADGGGSMYNDISIAYESVIYGQGTIGDNGEPQGFASAATRYDVEESPYGKVDTSSAGSIHNILTNKPRLIDRGNPAIQRSPLLRASNSASIPAPSNSVFTTLPGGLASTSIPLPESQGNITTAGSINPASPRSRDTTRLANNLQNVPGGVDSLVAKTINSGAIAGVNYADFASATPAQQSAIQETVLNNLSSGDSKAVNIANDILNDQGFA